MKKLSYLLFTVFIGITNLQANPSSFLTPPSTEGRLAMQNRILTRVNENTITVLDVMQKMALFLQKNYPEQSTSPLARSQFYISSWREFLHQMIDQELILADAKHMEVKISDKDVRESLLKRFGPNVMLTLDKIGVPFDKAKKLINDEMAIERMNWFRVHSKAYERISPKHIKLAYKEYVTNNPPTKELEYQVLSIRSSNSTDAKALTDRAYALLKDKTADFSTLLEHLPDSDEISISISTPYQTKESELSKAHSKALSTLQTEEFSTPTSQVSRFDNNEVFRIFFLKSQTETTPRTFEEMEKELKEELFGSAISTLTDEYVAKLRQQYGYELKYLKETIPEDFQPFSMQ